MLDSVWQRLTFNQFALHQWREVSYLHRCLAPLRQWRQSSWLLQWADGIGVLMLITLFVLAPYVSTALIGVLMLACAAFWVLLTVSDEAGEGLTPIHLAIVLYWTAMAIATVLSPVKAAALKGLIKLTLNVLVFLLMARVLRTPRYRTGLVSAYLLTTVAVSVYGLRQWFYGADALATWVDPLSPLAQTTRVYSYLGNPNLLASYLIPAVMLSFAAIFVWPRWVPKLLAVATLLLNTTCLILTFSRGGWMGFVAGGAVLAILTVHFWSVYFNRFWRLWAIPALLGMMAALLVFAVVFVEPIRDRVFSMFAGRNDSSNNFRMNVWASVIDMIKDRPLLGIGPGNDAFNSIYPLYQRPRFTALSAYSILLETTVEAGLIGLSCFLWLMVVTFTQAWQQIQRLRAARDVQGYWLIGAISAQIGLITHGLVDTVWYRPQVSTLWWLMLALVASYYLSGARRDWKLQI